MKGAVYEPHLYTFHSLMNKKGGYKIKEYSKYHVAVSYFQAHSYQKPRKNIMFGENHNLQSYNDWATIILYTTKESSENTWHIGLIDFCKFLFPTNIFSPLLLILLLYVIKGHWNFQQKRLEESCLFLISHHNFIEFFLHQ